MIYKPTCFVINAFAGHGKDTVKDFMAQYYQTKLIDSEQSSFAAKAKKMVADIIPEEVQNKFPDKNGVELLEYLKDNEHKIEIIPGFNTRKVLQVYLGNVLRTLDPNIHISWRAKEMHKSMIEKDFNTVFLCTDNRYLNERSFLLTLNTIESNIEKIDYLRYFVNKNKPNFTTQEIEKLFLEKFGSNEALKNPKIQKLIQSTQEALNELDIPKSVKKYEEANPDLSEKSFEEAMDLGFINIFRPMVSPDLKSEPIDLIEHIKTYSGTSDEKIQEMQYLYQSYGLSFDLKNLQKYGFLRADPSHPSEKELQKYLSERILNDPFDENQNNQLKTKLTQFLIKKENDLKNAPKKEKKETINISLPISLALDCEHIEKLAKLDIGLYKDTIKSISKKGLVLEEGLFSDIFKFTNHINTLSEDSNSPEFHMGIVTRNAPYDARLIHQSLKHHKIYPEFMAFTNGKSRSEFNKQFSVDFAYTHSNNSQNDHIKNKFLSLNISHLKRESNKVMDNPTIENVLNFYKSSILKTLKNIENKKIEENSIKEKAKIFYRKLVKIEEHFKDKMLLNFSLEGFNYKNENKLGEYTKIFHEKDYKIKNPKELNINFSSKCFKEYYNNGLGLLEKYIQIKQKNQSDIGININIINESSENFKIKESLKELLGEESFKNIVFKKEIDSKSDLFITSNKEECRKYNLKNIPSITITSDNKKLYEEDIKTINKGPLRAIFDLDEVVVKDEETLYRMHSLQFFNSFQENYYESPFHKGPLFDAFYKIGKISKHFEESKEEKPLIVSALTSRGGHFPCMRFMNFMEKNELYMDEALFMGGKEKTQHIIYNMKKDGFVNFIDDHPAHVSRILEAIEETELKNISVSQCVSGIHSLKLSEKNLFEKEKEKVKKLLQNAEKSKQKKTKIKTP